MQGRSLAPSWTPDGRFGNQPLPGRAPQGESNDLQLPWLHVNQCLSGANCGISTGSSTNLSRRPLGATQET